MNIEFLDEDKIEYIDIDPPVKEKVPLIDTLKNIFNKNETFLADGGKAILKRSFRKHIVFKKHYKQTKNTLLIYSPKKVLLEM